VNEPIQASDRARIDSLTGLRILAAMMVFLSHLGPPTQVPKAVKAFFFAGYSGVTIFFILSGFVLAHNYFDGLTRGARASALWSFAVARFARVYPLYILILLWVATPALVAGQPTPHLLDHTLALQAWSPDLLNTFAFNSPAWSIGVELFLYACFPLLVLALRPLGSRVWRILAAMMAVEIALIALTAWFIATGRDALPWVDPRSAHRWLYLAPPSRLGDFALGMLAARLVSSLPRDRKAARVGGGLALVGGLAIVALMAWPAHRYTAASWDVSYTVPALLLIVGLAIAPESWLARILGSAPFVLLGEASYAFYLCHAPLLERFAITAATGAPWLLAKGMTLLMILALAVGLHVLIERPVRGLVRRALAPRRAAAGAPDTTRVLTESPAIPECGGLATPSPASERATFRS
jgi:peptidoglycan/LPS O-acetylase OafA/YrhL